MSPVSPRRNFLRLIGAGGAVSVLPISVPGCDEPEAGPSCLPLQPPSDDPFDVWDPAEPGEDIRLNVLSYALLAPNPHNLQPWLVELRTDRELDVYVDPDRLLPETDPLYRQIHLGVGCFLELAEIAASNLGYRAMIELFPEGEYANDVLEFKPVARVRLVREAGVDPDPLFESIVTRSSNEETFDGEPIAPAALEQLRSVSVGGGLEVTVTDDSETLAELTRFVVDAMSLELGHAARDRETLDTWRFTDEELLEYRDGSDARWLAELGVDKAQLLEPGSPWVSTGVQIHEGRASSASAFGWFISSSNTRTDQVHSGRLYARINLLATKLGIAMSPFSQVLQEYSDMGELKVEFEQFVGASQTDTVQMLFCLGHAPLSPRSPRRRAEGFTPC